MPEYSKMYTQLFNAVTDAISILQKAQQKSEEQYVQSDEPTITLIRPEETEQE
mgnify:FL=1